MWLALEWLTALSAVGFALTLQIIPKLRTMFIKANLFGKDLNKKTAVLPNPIPDDVKVPEATGIITGCVFLMVTFVMIPLTFSGDLANLSAAQSSDFPHAEFAQLISALLSISCMLMLGFADDVLDLRWRHKLLLPTMASMPLLLVYYVTANRTQVVLPLFVQELLGQEYRSIDLGVLYYVFMGMLAVFCTNAINILAGINGLEVGQSVVIAASVALFNLRELDGVLGHYHKFSLYFLFPYLATSLPLLYYNWYPSRVFPGDTFCYFSGMTLAVVAILGHFSKTLLLFFIPQIVNFLYSVPQLFHLIPCPRHRLPKYDPVSDTVSMSYAKFKPEDMKFPGKHILDIFKLTRLVHIMDEKSEDGETYIKCNNLTIINFALKIFGPMHERTLTILLLVLQVMCSCVAFVIRYPLAKLLFGEVVA